MIENPCLKAGGGYFCQNRAWMCLPNLENLIFSIQFFFWPNSPPVSIPFLIKKHPILPKFGALYNNLLNIHPIFEFGLLRVSDENPSTATPNFATKHLKRLAHIIRIPCHVRTHPGLKDSSFTTSSARVVKRCHMGPYHQIMVKN